MSQICETVNFEAHNSPNLSFTNIHALHSNFVISESLHELDSPGILIYARQNLKIQLTLTISRIGYLPSIRKDSLTHMHSLAVCVKISDSYVFLLYFINLRIKCIDNPTTMK